MVGKNESGKTSLLTALKRVNPILTADKGFNWEHECPRRFLAVLTDFASGQKKT